MKQPLFYLTVTGKISQRVLIVPPMTKLSAHRVVKASKANGED